MTTHIERHGTVLQFLPGSEVMVGGKLLCMYHSIEGAPLMLEDWKCGGVYMRFAHERMERPYGGPECMAVQDAIYAMNHQPALTANVLFQGAHAPGHPLPGVFTVMLPGFRVDMRKHEHSHNTHLWAIVYRRRCVTHATASVVPLRQ